MGGYLARYPELVWAELGNLLLKEYADVRTEVEATRSLIKLTQARDKRTSVMGARAMEFSTTAFSEEVRVYAAIQVHLVNFFVDALGNERIRRDVINEDPVMLSVALNLAKVKVKIWEKTRNRGMHVQVREESGSIGKR